MAITSIVVCFRFDNHSDAESMMHTLEELPAGTLNHLPGENCTHRVRAHSPTSELIFPVRSIHSLKDKKQWWKSTTIPPALRARHG